MIIGRGDVAKAIKDRDGFTFYCNGVSNRLPLTEEAKSKEAYEIYRRDRNSTLVYISTLSIYYSDSEYTKHKMKMEELVKDQFENYCILRIGNITFGDNPNTLINHLKKDQSRIDNTYRYLINKDELNHWVGMIPKEGKHEMNITGQRTKIEDILYFIEDNIELIYSDRP